MIILAVDPGDTIGVASYDTDTHETYTAEAKSIVDLKTIVADLNIDVVVAEDFIIRPSYAKAFIGNRMQALRVLGALEWLADGQLVLQQSAIRQAWPDARVGEWAGFSVAPFSLHVRDALRHLAYYCNKRL